MPRSAGNVFSLRSREFGQLVSLRTRTCESLFSAPEGRLSSRSVLRGFISAPRVHVLLDPLADFLVRRASRHEIAELILIDACLLEEMLIHRTTELIIT